MRCPKCGYNSFDSNLVCPKCRKDLTATRRLLNLTVSPPRPTDFFRTAGQRTAFPEPFLEAVPDDLAPVMTLQALEPTPPPLQAAEITAQAGVTAYPASGAYGRPGLAEIFPEPDEIDDISPIDEVEDISPIEDEVEDISPVDDDVEDIEPVILEDELDDLEPLVEDGELDDIAPVIEPLAADGDDDEIEIEIDDFEPSAPESPVFAGEPFPEQATPLAPEAAPHQAALDQIKSTLAQTGDLIPPGEAELSPISYDLIDELDELDGADLEPLEEAPGQEAELSLDETDLLEADDLAAEEEPAVAPDSEDQAGPQEIYALNLDDLEPEALPEIPEAPQAAAVELGGDLDIGDLELPADTPPAPAPAETDTNVLDELDELDETPLAVLDTPLLDDGDLAIFPEDPEQPPEISLEPVFPEIPDQPLVPPAAVPEIPAAEFPAMPAPAADATLSVQLPSSGLPELGDELDDLVDNLNLDDLDDKL